MWSIGGLLVGLALMGLAFAGHDSLPFDAKRREAT
jgi:hypothetical protein